MRRHLGSTVRAVPLAVAAVLVGAASTIGAIGWSMTATPSSVVEDATATFHLTIENGTTQAEIYCIKIDVPLILDFGSAAVIGTNAATSWKASDSSSGGSGTRVFLIPTHADGHVHDGEWVKVDIKASGKTIGIGEWTARAYGQLDCSGPALLPSVTVDVAVVGTATPTPRPSPTPSPTPSPKPSPSPSPTPTPEPSPTPTRTPTPRPSPMPQPSPAATPTASPTPSPSVRPTASPHPTPGPSPAPSVSTAPTLSPQPSPAVGASPSPSSDPSAEPSPSASSGDGTPPGAGVGSGPGGSRSGGSAAGGTGGGSSGGREEPPVRMAGGAPGDDAGDQVSSSISVGLDALRMLDDGHEWLVPLFVVSIPGFLVILAILGQSIAGLIWLVPVRRSLATPDRSGPRLTDRSL